MSALKMSETPHQEQRRHPRVKMSMRVSLSISEDGSFDATTRDISDGGVFIIMDRNQLPEVGETVSVQVQGLPGGNAPWVEMEVVRKAADGVGLRIKN